MRQITVHVTLAHDRAARPERWRCARPSSACRSRSATSGEPAGAVRGPVAVGAPRAVTTRTRGASTHCGMARRYAASKAKLDSGDLGHNRGSARAALLWGSVLAML